jgi:uncharacterized protein YkwD
MPTHAAMATGIRTSLPALAAVLTVALLALALSAREASAGGEACDRWGGVNTPNLAKKEARKSVLCLLNEERRQAGVPKASRSRKLQNAAQRHSNHMHNAGCFAHQCPGEPALDGRLRGSGYLHDKLTRWSYAENVAWGSQDYGTPKSIVEAWMDSPPHRSSMLNGSLRDVGVGVAKGTPSSKGADGGLYTLDFGDRDR